jgi:snoRNA binding domain, fibrillarin
VPGALIAGCGPDLYLLPPDSRRALPVPLNGPLRTSPRPSLDPDPARLPDDLIVALEGHREWTDVVAGTPELVAALGARLRRPVRVASLADLRRLRAFLPALDPATERAYVLEVAQRDLERVLRSPEEILVSLAREEERVERVVGREERAAEALLAPAGTALASYAAEAGHLRAGLVRHHAELARRVEAAAREVVPNLAALVGPRTAARLVSAAGGLSPLGRMRGARLQLLGARRRPSPTRGPRYGVLFRAERMEDVPLERRAAYARSLAALAAIAARADATTRREIAPLLRARRDRRIAELRGRRR